MCIYCGTKNYRKIYIHHNGSIPLDEDGRTYEIHHVDGNHDNNDPVNLIAISIKEHYNIHHSQEDWAACMRIATRMNHTVSQISELSSNEQKKRLKNGTHHFTNDNHKENTRKRVKLLYKDGNHPFQRQEVAEKIKTIASETQIKRYESGEHQFLKPEIKELAKKRASESNEKRIKDGTHPFVDPVKRKKALDKQISEGSHVTQNSKIQRQKALTRIKNGTHPWIQEDYQSNLNKKMLEENKHPSQKKVTCEHCGRTLDSPNYNRWHGEKCSSKFR